MNEDTKSKVRQAAEGLAEQLGAGNNQSARRETPASGNGRRSVIVKGEGGDGSTGYATTHDPAVGEVTGVKGSAVRVLPDGRRVLSDVVDHLGSVGRVPVGGWMVCTVGVFGGRTVAVQLTVKGEWTTRGYDSGRWDTEEDAKRAAGDAAAVLAGAADRWERLGRDGMADRVRAQLAGIRVVAG